MAVPSCAPISIQDSAVNVYLDTDWLSMTGRAFKVSHIHQRRLEFGFMKHDSQKKEPKKIVLHLEPFLLV